MWIEQYLESTLNVEKSGFADAKTFLADCERVSPAAPPSDGKAIFPVLSCQDGSQYLVNSYETHTLIAGCTGSGKTRRVLIPAIMNAMMVSDPARRPSMFVFDVKGELSAITSKLAVQQGYQTITVDLISPKNSCGYDVSALARELYAAGDTAGCENALAELASAISPLPAKNNTMDPFWARTAQAALIGTALYMLDENHKKFSFPALAAKLMSVLGDEDEAREFAREVQRRCGSESSAARMIKTAVSGSDKTIQNVCTTVMADISEFTKTQELMQVLRRPMPVGMNTLVEKPTIIYFKTAESVPAFYTFGRLVFTQIYQRLQKEAGTGVLRRPFEFFMDEICNGAGINTLPRMLAMSRSKGIRIHLVVQSLKQLEAAYQEEADTIRSSCGLFIVLRTTDPGTWDRVSSLAGVDIRGYQLMSPRKLAHLEMGRALIITPNHLPYMARLEDCSALKWQKKRSTNKGAERHE